jgi:hypothetical protein
MRMPRVRFTVRRMMVAAAIVARLLGAVLHVVARKRRFLAIASAHAQAVRPWLMAGTFDEHGEKFARHPMMRSMYLSAAMRPWLPVAADPPARE